MKVHRIEFVECNDREFMKLCEVLRSSEAAVNYREEIQNGHHSGTVQRFGLIYFGPL